MTVRDNLEMEEQQLLVEDVLYNYLVNFDHLHKLLH